MSNPDPLHPHLMWRGTLWLWSSTVRIMGRVLSGTLPGTITQAVS